MKKETINTFSKGMVRDLHPLTTPDNVLTDALNATFITYNGNENILQNDMGNVKLKNAFLESGYVPVGMKEYGGIIYVAAWDPVNKKGQVGSFPSPRLLWEDENWSINKPEALTVPKVKLDFYDSTNPKLIINEISKNTIFTTNNGARIFHPGDKFCISIPNKEDFRRFIEDGLMSIQLGVVKSDGSIEIMRTWDSNGGDNFIITGTPLINTSSQVFDASSSGLLILIFNLHTLDSFNLVRSYKIIEIEDGNNTRSAIQVTLTGEATKNGESVSQNNFGIVRGTNSTPTTSIIVTEQEEDTPVDLDIYPAVPLGIIDRMKKPIRINFSKIRKNSDDFSEWRFFVAKDYVKIGWAYDFYNLDGSKELDYIRMYFHKLEDGYKANREGVAYVTFLKEYYSGNFEDYINYNDVSPKLEYENIYIVEIVKKFKDTSLIEYQEEIIAFKMLYLTPLYNSLYNGFYKNNAIGGGENKEETREFKPIDPQPAIVDITYDLNTKLKTSKSKLKTPGDEGFGEEINTEELRSNMYITTKDEVANILDLSTLKYETKTTDTYQSTLTLNGTLTNLNEYIIGTPKATIIDEVLSDYEINEIKSTVEREWKESTNNKEIFNSSNINDTVTILISDSVVNENIKTIIKEGIMEVSGIEFSDTRDIEGKMSDLQSTSYETKGLQPLYAPSYASNKKSKIAPYWKMDESRCLSGAGDDEGICYNSTLTKAGDIIEGPNSGGGGDDGGLFTASQLMGNPMTNIFSGSHGESAEIVFDNGHHLDYLDDNFLIACWKFTDGNTHFINIVTPRYSDNKENFVKSETVNPRLDVIMRCILSLIFVVNRTTKNIEYYTTSDKFYRYTEGNTILNISFKKKEDALEITDIMYSGEHPITEYLVSSDNRIYNDSLAQAWHWLNGKITVDGKNYEFENLIPVVNVAVTDLPEKLFEIQSFYDLDLMLLYYLGIEFSQNDIPNSDLDPKCIYGIDTSKSGVNALACAKNSGNKPKANIDGTYEWIKTPECVAINGNLSIYKWNDASIITLLNFASRFETTAKNLDWTDIPEGEENEVLAKSTNFWYGTWTNAKDEDAPDMYYEVILEAASGNNIPKYTP